MSVNVFILDELDVWHYHSYTSYNRSPLHYDGPRTSVDEAADPKMLCPGNEFYIIQDSKTSDCHVDALRDALLRANAERRVHVLRAEFSPSDMSDGDKILSAIHLDKYEHEHCGRYGVYERLTRLPKDELVKKTQAAHAHFSKKTFNGVPEFPSM